MWSIFQRASFAKKAGQSIISVVVNNQACSRYISGRLTKKSNSKHPSRFDSRPQFASAGVAICSACELHPRLLIQKLHVPPIVVASASNHEPNTLLTAIASYLSPRRKSICHSYQNISLSLSLGIGCKGASGFSHQTINTRIACTSSMFLLINTTV